MATVTERLTRAAELIAEIGHDPTAVHLYGPTSVDLIFGAELGLPADTVAATLALRGWMPAQTALRSNGDRTLRQHLWVHDGLAVVLMEPTTAPSTVEVAP